MFYLDADKTAPLESLHVPTLPSRGRVRTSHKVILGDKQYRVYADSMNHGSGHYILVNRKEVKIY